MEKSVKVSVTEFIFIVFLLVSVIFILSVFPTLIWFAFDDALASLFNMPALGNLSFWNVYPFTLFISWLFYKPKIEKKDIDIE